MNVFHTPALLNEGPLSYVTRSGRPAKACTSDAVEPFIVSGPTKNESLRDVLAALPAAANAKGGYKCC